MKLLDCYMPVFILITDIEANHQQYDCFQYTRDKFTLAIEQAVSLAESINVTDRERDDAFYAVTVLIDEKILCSSLIFRDEWRDSLLQYKYFGSSVGGEQFFEKLDNLDKNNSEAVGVFLCCLLLGFKGKYIDNEQDVINDYILTLRDIFFNGKTTWGEDLVIEKNMTIKRVWRPTIRNSILVILSFYLIISFFLII
ncbi:DotU family type IV/VI secretion system protein [Yersinia enterocolitica]|uniref:DotU family type IV/VI secretion system protein n=1 Tax=Yersinia enterocolitica TaxID=630 RepID=UPI001C60AA77|nr:DotU family type IV/VI secretion system protein [Yersinia enterocolitica]MBW5823010.1 DotU family type IV/VI secretion system protein [Yersinia enterocolitica]MBW5852882.1 DotU family type IV/VI secretion system protein [Yersinia enterocolitica]MBW5870238.1 DotU family type IV/VI secretion system protein [Yersinia enterocolitica]MBW5879032.1 DotU family type IV/VI secretion system protein [Yersinia enterocolitica]MBX9477238.1 DotU family type IV/VI secretion system protein [Yersinia enteroc